jgi:hypothetical protein
MKRVLDIDLDFFLHGVVYWLPEGLPRSNCDVTGTNEAVPFLSERMPAWDAYTTGWV